jgi:hypothetical protein
MVERPPAAARWIITRDANSVCVHHRHISTGHQQPLGRLDGEVTDEQVLEWIDSFGHPNVGDEVLLSCGSLVRWLPAGYEVQELCLDGMTVFSFKSIVLA